MQSFHSSDNISQLGFLDQVTKIDRILRLYRLNKKNDTSMEPEVKKIIEGILKEMNIINAEKFKIIQSSVMKNIEDSLTSVKAHSDSSSQVEARPETQKKETEKGNPPSSFGAVSIKLSAEKQESFSKESQKMKQSASSIERIEESNEKMIPKIGNSFFDGFEKSEESQEASNSSSQSKGSANLQQFCYNNMNLLESKLAINDDVITYFKEQDPKKVLLLGVQKPQDSAKDKIYICTIMQFEKEEVISLKLKGKLFENEINEFENVIRCPLALCVIGENITNLKIHYAKFLLEVGSPVPIIIIFNQNANEKSILIRLTDKAINSIQNTNMIEIEKLQQNFIKDKKMHKCSKLLETIAVVKDKFVSTKILERKYTRKIYENNQAIMIENKPLQEEKMRETQFVDLPDKFEMPTPEPQSKAKISQLPSSDSLLRNESEDFIYKLHSKFISACPKEQFYIYQINEENELYCRKKIANLAEGAAYINKKQAKCILAFTVKNDKTVISSAYFLDLFSCQEQCPMFLIRFKSLTAHKAAFFVFRPKINVEHLKNQELTFKSIEANENQFTSLIINISKGNAAQYETKHAVQEFENLN